MFKPSLIVIVSFLMLVTSGSLDSKHHKHKYLQKFQKETLLMSREGKMSNSCKCGTIFHEGAQDFVISGKEVKDASNYPFMITIHLTNSKSTWRGCGGAIISPTFIITAAHCVYNDFKLHPDSTCITKLKKNCYLTPKRLKIGVFSEKSAKKPHIYRGIEKIIPHPDYDRVLHPHDIALIKLKEPLECTKYTRPICISEEEDVGIGQNLNVAGYGRIDSNSQVVSKVLRKGLMKRVEQQKCGYEVKDIICTVGETESACMGDSGTVSFIQREGRYLAVGVTSAHRDKNCRLGNFAFFTSISKHYAFIKQYVDDLPNF